MLHFAGASSSFKCRKGRPSAALLFHFLKMLFSSKHSLPLIASSLFQSILFANSIFKYFQYLFPILQNEIFFFFSVEEFFFQEKMPCREAHFSTMEIFKNYFILYGTAAAAAAASVNNL